MLTVLVCLALGAWALEIAIYITQRDPGGPWASIWNTSLFLSIIMSTGMAFAILLTEVILPHFRH